MALVAYANSSDSEDSEDSVPNARVLKLNGDLSDLNEDKVRSTNTSLFTTLPQPITLLSDSVIEEHDEFLNKKEVPTEKPEQIKQPIKITIPSLSQFDSDEDEPSAKKPKVQEKASGLFAVLPPPKTEVPTSKQFVPNVVRSINKQKIRPQGKPKRPVIPTFEDRKQDNDKSGSDDDIGIPETFDDETWQKVCGRRKQTTKPIIALPTISQVIELAPESVKPYKGLDNQAFKELMGANSKRKGENVDIIEINEDEILPDKEVWMTKSLTDPEMAPKYVVQDPVNDTCKRKHHITYLAQQAKANEQDLKNQWAQNRFTRQKTQAKYGF